MLLLMHVFRRRDISKPTRTLTITIILTLTIVTFIERPANFARDLANYSQSDCIVHIRYPLYCAQRCVYNIQSGYINGAIKGHRYVMFTALPMHMCSRLKREKQVQNVKALRMISLR